MTARPTCRHAPHGAQVRADERQKVAALLADEGTVEKVAEEVWAESASPGAAPTDAHRAVARAALGVIARLIENRDLGGCQHIYPDGTRCTLTDHSAPGVASVHGLIGGEGE